jgi:NACHT domain- and WD repeat-containing protein
MNLLCATFDIRSLLVTLTNYTVSDGDITYKIEYNCKIGTEYKNFLITSDEMYLVIYRNDKKSDTLAIHNALDGTSLHNVKLAYLNYKEDFHTMVSMTKTPHMIAIIDADKGNLINIRDKKFIRSIPKWNGKATKDDKHGLYAPSRGGLELLDLKSGKQVKIFIPKIAEGVFDIDTLITPNDK